jgi:hypothetical protein
MKMGNDRQLVLSAAFRSHTPLVVLSHKRTQAIEENHVSMKMVISKNSIVSTIASNM